MLHTLRLLSLDVPIEADIVTRVKGSGVIVINVALALHKCQKSRDSWGMVGFVGRYLHLLLLEIRHSSLSRPLQVVGH